jgi:hypothetical protein
MNEPITLPPLDEIAQRIRDCRAELAALRKLYRMARAAQAAGLGNCCRPRAEAAVAPEVSRNAS